LGEGKGGSGEAFGTTSPKSGQEKGAARGEEATKNCPLLVLKMRDGGIGVPPPRLKALP